MTRYDFKYGRTKLWGDMDDRGIIHSLLPRTVEPILNVEEEIARVLENPTASAPLREVIGAGETVAIVVSDVTRLWVRTRDFLIHIIDYINALGVKDTDIEVIIALGTHRPSTEDEKRALVGEEVYSRIKVHDHNCFDKAQLVYMGNSKLGTPTYINERVIKADRVIITGGIVFHLFAGFGGGAKSIVPGVAGLEKIQYNHRLTFNEWEGGGLNPKACSNRIDGNPMREDITDICELVNPDFLFNVVLDSEGNFLKFVAGHHQQAWLEGCEFIRSIYGVGIEERADIVVASAGGYPKDINLYQTVKTMDNCLYAGKESSIVILLSECSEGLGADEFMEWFRYKSLEEMEAALKRNFTVPGYAAYKTAHTAKHRRLILISSLPKEIVEGLGFITAGTLDDALKLAYSLTTENPSMILMPYGGNTLPMDVKL